MHRSFLSSVLRPAKAGKVCHCLARATAAENQKSLLRCHISNPSVSSFVINKSFHTSLRLRDEDEGEKAGKKKSPRKRRVNLPSSDEELLRSSAVEAAKSLPGDWNRTADELMSRLSIKAKEEVEGAEDKEPTSQHSSLLSTMKVGRSSQMTLGRNKNRQGNDEGVGERIFMRKRLIRKSETFTSLYSQPRLGVFDADKLKAIAKKDEAPAAPEVGLWAVVEKEKLTKSRGSLPRNGFEEMIQWTKEGRMWSFPVDNEEDMHEEREYQFHQHVFLNEHLKDFPTEGPLRRFMDLVVIGLSKNPWISVPEKVDHIQWYADYFKQKQKLLETSMGGKAHMKQ